MSNDSLAAVLEAAAAALSAAEADLARERGTAPQGGRDEQVLRLREAEARLRNFRRRLVDLQGDWRRLEPGLRERVRVNAHGPTPRARTAQTLRVRLGTGQIIQEETPERTLTAVLEALGLDAVRALPLTVNGVPLVAGKKHPVYRQVQSGSYFIMTHSSVASKKWTLEEVARRLGTQLEVEVVEPGSPT